MKKVAIVGCGFVGASWAIVFARAGYSVALYDPTPGSIDTAVRLAAEFLNGQEGADVVLARLRPATDLADAVTGATYVQESSPERLDIKLSLYTDLAALTGENTILASSTSGFPASAFAGHTDAAHRTIVSHPINPPHLVPVVEIVPSADTDRAIVEETERLMREVGQVPIHLNKEINGFVVNRLQSAVLAEAFRLVEDGVASVADIDLAMTEGLALRWFFIGPFETIDLNANGGVADYCAKLGPMYHGLAKEQADPREWSQALILDVEAQRRTALPAEQLEARRAWRDRTLARFVAAKREALSGAH